MEKLLEIAVWVVACVLVLLLLFLGMVIAIDRSGDGVAGAPRQRGRRRSSTFWWGIWICGLAAAYATIPLLDQRAQLPWRHLYVERWQVGMLSALLAFVGLRLVMLGRRFPAEPKAETQDEAKSDDFASTPDEDGL